MQQNVYISIKNNTSLSKSYIKSYSLEEGLDVFNEWMDKINATYQPIADAYKDLEEKIGNLVKTLEKDLIKYSQEVNKRNFSYQMKRVKMERLEKELNNLNSLTQEYQLKKIEITNFRKELNNSRHLYLLATKNQFLTKNLLVLSRPMGGILEKQCPLAKYGGLVYDGLSIVRKFQKIYLSIPNPCEKDLNKANDCRTMSIAAGVYAGGLLTTKIGVEAMMDIATATQVVASGVTGGVSLGTAFATVVGKMVAGIALDVAFNWEIDKREAQIRSVIAQLKCSDNNNDGNDNNDDDDDDDKKKKGGKHKPKGPGVEGVHDPSGYVYEGVPSNRLEGVMASCYYKEEVEDMYGDKQENVVLWNAENYAQENPLFTDENGMYRWDVPQGLWQVKFEKDGYQTTYSEWLPVPPPQLEVNVEMVQNIQPKVDNVKVYEQGIDIEFSKYMSIESINVDNIIVSQNGENFAGTITLLDEEQTYLDNTKTYVSKVRFNPLIEFSANEKVTLKVSRKVKSYTGMQMEADYIQTFDIAKEVKSIKADSIVILSYDSSKEIEVEILPAEAAVGKFLIVESISPTIASIARDTIKIGENGKINVTITGELPGNAAINFTIDSTDISATTLVKVVNKVEEPYVSIESGTAVYYGTKISLNCNTEDAVIYYTLDGSCPCDDNAIKYSEPITIDKNMIIKALAVSIDGIESEIVEFQYTLKPYTVILSAENGSVFGGGEYNHGEEITISAIPNDGYEFVKWSDDNIENPRKLIVTQDIILKAIFVRLDATLIDNINEELSNIVYYGNGIICVVNKGKSYEIFDASGKLIYTGRESVLSLPRGVYVVVIEGEVEKVVL